MLVTKHRAVRAMACFLLVESIGSLSASSVVWAASGPSQPEYTSYEALGTTDMVKLSTGDFSYSIPVLDIPGPERSFSLPLTYKSGIALEQEASWVGLGWSLNAGAIARSVNGYPDDADNEPCQLNFHKQIQNGTSYAVIPGVWNVTWNSNTGNGGSVDLLGLASVNWDRDGVSGGDLIGIGYQKGKGFSGDPVRFAMAVVTIATLGVSTAATTAAKVGLSLGEGVAIATGMGVLGLGRQGGVSGFNNKPSLWERDEFPETVYTQHVTTKTTERRYGSLYFGKMSQSLGNGNTGPSIALGTSQFNAPQFAATRQCSDVSGLTSTETAADVYQYGDVSSDGNDGYYTSSRRPVSIAHDYYSVMGEAVSGTIRPHRLEVGSIAYPKLGRDECDKHQKFMVVPYLNDYKVPFRYEGSLSNGYDYHRYSPAATQSPTGVDVAANQNNLVLTDPRFEINTRTEPVRKGLNNSSATGRQLVQGKHTVWYSNREIEQMAAGIANGYPDGFLNFATPVAGSGTNDAFRHQLPPDGIGAFAVTAEDGTTYHYSLPVYQFKTYSESNENYPYAPNGSEQGRSTVMEGSADPIASSPPAPANPNQHGGYATTWLLTAITSPDYIDRNNSGTLDAGDWGGWVNFSYGKFSSRYKWRQPYIGNSYSDAAEPIVYEGHTEGYKETYYLDRIATRTHTALFVKSIRKDARGHFTAGQQLSPVLNINDSQPASSLRLDEIILLDNTALAKVATVNGIRTPSDPVTVPAFTNDTNQNGGAEAVCGDALSRVLDAGDLAADVRIKTFVEASAIKRVHFNYGYDLCRGVPSSFDYSYANPGTYPPMDEAQAAVHREGKLTLKSVSFFGPTLNAVPTKIIPDFTFGYEAGTGDVGNTNPAYGKEKWDAFGMYCAAGAHNTTSHKPAGYAPTAAPWTLRRITSPLGGVTEISYERDVYAHVSDAGTRKTQFHANGSNILTLVNPGGRNLTDYIQPNDYLELSGDVTAYCQKNTQPFPNATAATTQHYTNERVQVVAVTSSAITVSRSFSPACSAPATAVGTPSGELYTALPENVPGGDVRVAAITSTNPASDEKYQIRYKYTAGTNPQLNSTGVIAKEPAFLDKASHSFEQQFDYPSTPVLYSQVTVLRGLFRNGDDKDFKEREVYDFFTPVSAMVVEQMSPDFRPGLANPNGGQGSYQAEFYNNQVTVKTGLIGQPKAVRVYNAQGQQELGTAFGYDDHVTNAEGIANQGHFTEGAMTNELLDEHFYRTNRTTKEYVPAVLTSSRSTRNGISIESANELYDFYTGQVLASAFTNSRGKKYHSISVPAYTLAAYASMGAKGDNASNSHMLAQQAASYVVAELPGSPPYDARNPLNPQTSSILSAGVKTWQQNWTTYRIPTATGRYQDDPVPQRPVWREQAAYAWQSPMLNPDGSYSAFVDYNWNGISSSHWVKVAETVRYDHYSHGLESRDVNGRYSASKTGHSESQVLVSAANARYTELAYSGAEDVPVFLNNLKHFGGEVVTDGTQADGSQGMPAAHTGAYSLKLVGSQKVLYLATGGAELAVSQPYRLSAWLHSSDAVANLGQLYASVNGTDLGTASISAATTKKAGTWYRVELKVTLPAGANGQAVEFGCRNAASSGSPAAVYVDDFRVSPLTAALTSQVYDPRTNQLLYSLDNENLYTRYDYNRVGRLQRVYKEAFDRPNEAAVTPRLVKEYGYNYNQLYAPTWITDSYRCPTDANGNNFGLEERHVVDANPLNAVAPRTPVPARWENNGYSLICQPVPCLNQTDSQGHLSAVFRLRGNSCEQAEDQGIRCVPTTTPGGMPGYTISHRFVFHNPEYIVDDNEYFSTQGCVSTRSQPARALTPTRRTAPRRPAN